MPASHYATGTRGPWEFTRRRWGDVMESIHFLGVLRREGSGASGDFRVFRASISTDVSSCAPSQTLAFPAIPQATTDGAAVSRLRKMMQLPQMQTGLKESFCALTAARIQCEHRSVNRLVPH